MKRTALAALVLLTACGDPRPEPGPAPPDAPTAVDTGGMTADQLAAAILEHCHGPLQLGMDRVAVEVTLPDGARLEAFTALPDHLRVQQEGAPPQILTGADAFLLAGEVAQAVDATSLERLRALRLLLDAATLGPLYRRTAVERLPDGLLARQGDGTAWEIHLQPGTLLPERLQSGATAVHLRQHLRTSATWIPQQVELAPLGRCTLAFRSLDVSWDEAFFARPGAVATPAVVTPPPTVLSTGPEARSRTPQPGRNRAASWIVVDDPGSWAERAAVYRRHAAVLKENGQSLAGFGGFLREGGRDRMVIPFRPRQGAAPFTPPADWQVRPQPDANVLVVYPEGTDFADKVRNGQQALQAALQAAGHPATGPFLAQPFVHLEDGEPAAAKLASMEVRMTVVLP